MSDLASVLRRQDGVVSRSQAMAFVSADAVDRLVAAGRWQLVHRGVYASHNGPLTDGQRRWAACLSGGAGQPALLGGLSALIALGLARFASPLIHIVVPHHRRIVRPAPGVRIHRTRVLPAAATTEYGGPPCSGAARSVVDAARWARSDQEARTIIAVAYQQRLVTGDEVAVVATGMRSLRRRALIIRTANDAAGGSQSLSELDLVTLCRRGGLPVPQRQVLRVDAAGRRRYLDAAFTRWGVRVEVDGAQHLSADQWYEDMTRHNDLSLRGEVVLRFPVVQLRTDPTAVAAVIRRALRQAGWNGES